MALPRLTTIEPGMINQMLAMLPRQTAEDIQDCLGISLNTWTKLRKGEAIRHSVAARLIARVDGGQVRNAA